MNKILQTMLCCALLCLIAFDSGCTKRKKTAASHVQMCMGDPQLTNNIQAMGLRKLDKLVWRDKVHNETFRVMPGSCIIVANDYFYYLDEARTLHAYHREDRKKGWLYGEGLDPNTTPPLIVDDILYVGTENGGLVALDRLTGKNIWRYQTKKSWFQIQMLPISTPLAYYDGVIFFGNIAKQVFAFDIGSRSLLWSKKISDNISSPISAANGAIYFGSDDGNVYSLSIDDGAEKWRLSAKGVLHSAPVVDGNAVVFRDANGSLISVNAATGALEWNFPTAIPSKTAPAVSNNTAYIGDEDGNLIAVDMQSGQEKWRLKMESGIVASPLAAGEVIYFVTKDRQFNVVDAEKALLLSQYPLEGGVDCTFGVTDNLIVVVDNLGYITGLSEER